MESLCKQLRDTNQSQIAPVSTRMQKKVFSFVCRFFHYYFSPQPHQPLSPTYLRPPLPSSRSDATQQPSAFYYIWHPTAFMLETKNCENIYD